MLRGSSGQSLAGLAAGLAVAAVAGVVFGMLAVAAGGVQGRLTVEVDGAAVYAAYGARLREDVLRAAPSPPSQPAGFAAVSVSGFTVRTWTEGGPLCVRYQFSPVGPRRLLRAAWPPPGGGPCGQPSAVFVDAATLSESSLAASLPLAGFCFDSPSPPYVHLVGLVDSPAGPACAFSPPPGNLTVEGRGGVRVILPALYAVSRAWLPP